MDAVRRWQFKPATCEQPVADEVRVPIVFFPSAVSENAHLVPVLRTQTFGADADPHRPGAAIRTDAQLQPISEPISFFVQPANDLLPAPIAALITGITPQAALRDGITGPLRFPRILDAVTRTPGAATTHCALMMEFVRYELLSQIFMTYEREWRCRQLALGFCWMLRLMHTLRPMASCGGSVRMARGTSFKLGHLAEITACVSIAHEALSDVRALIGLARLFRRHQPKLWDYALRLRDKRFAASLLDPIAMTPLLHISQRYPAVRLCAAPVLPLAQHPSIPSPLLPWIWIWIPIPNRC